MIDKKVNAEEQVQRMKHLMNYGMNESKQPVYSNVEYSKMAADGKLYGIVREGAKYYIKVAKDTNGNLVSENFDYIGGFRNRKDNMFESFASAQRFFCEKLMCINESIDDKQKRVIAESWNLEEKKEVIEEGTRKMQAEIARQRQIMMNAQKINEGKSQCCDMEDCPKCDTMKVEEPDAKPGAPFTKKVGDAEIKQNDKTNITGKQKPVVGNKSAANESAETPLSSRQNPDYMDTSHGTKIGDNTPFVNNVEDKPEDAVADAPGGEAEKEPELKNVNEETSMVYNDNQNAPTPGVGEKGDNEPYDEKAEITEDVDIDDELEDDAEIDDIDLDDEQETDIDNNEGDDEIIGGEDENEPMDIEDVEDEVIVDEPENDTEARLNAMEDKLNKILDAINNLKYDDDDTLYDDDEDDLDNSEEEVDDEEIVEPNGEVEDEEEYEVVESKSYKAMMESQKNYHRALELDPRTNPNKKASKEDVDAFKARQAKRDAHNKEVDAERGVVTEENDFGKHPAFQKKVMTTPPTNMPEKEGQYDMNDESAEEDKPYATQKGSNAPFDVNPEQIENAITEAVMNVLKKKLA